MGHRLECLAKVKHRIDVNQLKESRVFSNELLNANDQPGTGDNSVLRIVNEASGTVSGVRLPA